MRVLHIKLCTSAHTTDTLPYQISVLQMRQPINANRTVNGKQCYIDIAPPATTSPVYLIKSTK